MGWLELPEALARLNVSRILSGVVGNLGNDTSGKRRFVWDEMYFLHWCAVAEAPPPHPLPFRPAPAIPSTT